MRPGCADNARSLFRQSCHHRCWVHESETCPTWRCRGCVTGRCHTHLGSRAAAVSPRGGRSATGTAPVPPEEDPATRHTADVVKRTSAGVPRRESGPCLSRRDHPGLTRRGLSPAVSEREFHHDRTSRWDLRAQRAGVCRVAQREPARIRLLGADQLHASGGMPQRAAASQARASAKLAGRGLGLARRGATGPRSKRHL